MKVLFTFNGLPHYYNFVLSRLNSIKNVNINVIIPDVANTTLGKGVHQSVEGIDFVVHKLPEYKTYYKKYFYKGFLSTVKHIKPEVIVFVWPYNLALLFFPWIFIYLKLKRIKLVYKDIPFLLPKFMNGLTGKNLSLLNEDLTPFKLTITKRVYFIFFSLMRLVYYRFFDAHVNYVEDALDILPTYGVNKKSIFITYNSPDTDLLFKAKASALNISPLLPESSMRIVHVGRLVKWKKVDLLINAINKLKDKYPAIELIIIGSGPEESNLHSQVKRLVLEDNVKFVGAIYDPVVLGRYLLDSTIYVIAGIGGLSINEAMLFGKPVICSVCDGTEKKLVRDYFNGLFFNNDDLDDLVSKIDYILESKDRITQFGNASLSIIENEVNITTVLKGYISAFNFVTNNKFNLSL